MTRKTVKAIRPQNIAIVPSLNAPSSNLQAQTNSPNNVLVQYTEMQFTIPAGEQVALSGQARWLENILLVDGSGDTISAQLYPNGGFEPLRLGIQIILDKPTSDIRLMNYGTEDVTFVIATGAGQFPAVDHRLIFNNEDTLNVNIAGSSGYVPVTAEVSQIGGTAFGPISASGVAIPLSVGKTIVLRSAVLEVSGSGQALYAVTNGAGGRIFGVVTVVGGTSLGNLPFPVQTGIGDTINLLQVSASGSVAATLSGTFDYV